MVNAVEYVKAVALRLDDVDEDYGLLPTLLAMACVDVLPIAGAGLSIISDLRIPLGASDAVAALAEQLQVTYGGPCLAAGERGEPAVHDDDSIDREWPLYHRALHAHTPYRSVSSMPLSLGGYVGALDLYSRDPTAAALPLHEEVWVAVGKSIVELMVDGPTGLDRLGLELPTWLLTDRVDTRLGVWVAVGMIMQTSGLSSDDSLAVLRAYSFARSRTLDECAADLANGRVVAADVIGQGE